MTWISWTILGICLVVWLLLDWIVPPVDLSPPTPEERSRLPFHPDNSEENEE